MATYTALMNVVVDATEASQGLNKLDKNLSSIKKSSKSTSTSLSSLEKKFNKIEKSINSAVAPIVKMQRSLDRLVGKQMSGYQKIILSLIRQNQKFSQTVQNMDKDISKLSDQISKLSKRVDTLETKLKKVGSGKTPEGLGKLTDLFKKLGNAIRRNEYILYSFSSAVLNFIKINLLGALIRLTDQYVLMENRIRLVNSQQNAFNNNMAAVKQIAQETRQSLYAIANLYSRVGRNSKELGADTIALATTVSTIAKSFQIAGATAEEARNAIVQLSQALASGRLQGDELRSILELAPTLANSIAKSIGITLGSLRSFASEGLITTSIITKAVRESAKEIDEEFKKIVPTIGQSITNIQNAFQIILGETKEIKEANEIAALSFLKLAKDIETLAGGPAMTALGKFLKDIALSIDELIIGLTAFVAILGGLVVVGVLAALFGSLAGAITALAVAFGGAAATVYAFKNATEQLAIPIKSVDEVVKDVNKQLDDNAEKTGKAATGAERAAAQFTALKTESYNAGLQIDLLNRKIADLNQKLEEGEPIYLSGIGKLFSGINKGMAEFFGTEESEFSKRINEWLFSSDKKAVEKEVNKLKTIVATATSSQSEIDKEIKKRADAAGDDGKTAGEEFVQNFLDSTQRTNRRLSARFQEIRDAFQEKLNKPFDIRFAPAKAALVELNDALRQKIGDIGEKRAKGSQLEFGGVGLDVNALRDMALSDQQLTAQGLGITTAISSMLAGNKIVQEAGESIPKVLLAEIEAAANEELLKFQEKILAVEAEMKAGLAQRTRDQERINELMSNQNAFAEAELEVLKDGARSHFLKLNQIGSEYDLKIKNLEIDMKAQGYLKEEINDQIDLLKVEKQRAIEAEKIAKAKSDLLYLESELDKLRSAQFELSLADKEYALLKSYNSEFDRRTMLRQEERRLLLDMKKIEWDIQGLQGEKLKQAQEIFQAQLDTEDSLRRQQLLLAEALKTDQERLNFEALSRQYQSEAMNDWAERNRLDAFLMRDQIQNLNKYNAEVIKATQDAGLSVDFLINDKNVLDEYGLSLLELPAKLDGVDQTLLKNLRERIEYLKEILGLENEINKRKDSSEGSDLIKLIKEFMPDANIKGTFENEFLSNVVEFGKGQRYQKDAQAALAGRSDYIPELMGEQVAGDVGILGKIGSMFGEIFENFAGIFEAGFDALLNTTLSTYGILVKILLAVLSNAKFQEGLNSILDPWNKMFDDIADGIGQIFQGVGALLEPLTGVFNIIGGFVRGFFRSFTRVIEPIGKLLESLQPLIIIIGAAIQSFLLIINQIFGFVGDLFDQIAEFLGGATEDGYKSLVLLKAERDVLQEIETSLDGVVDVLKKIDDVLFEIVNSSLNLAAPSIKLENAAEKYDELFEAATRFGADDQAIDEFTAFAKQFLQQSQDVLKSSKAYQDIYDRVIQDIMSVTDSFIENLGEDVTETLQKGVFDLTIVGSDLASAIDQIVDKYEDGAITFGTVADYMSYKLSQIEEDIALREVAEFGAIDIGAEFERFQEMRGAAVSSSSLSEDLDVLTSSTSNLTSAVLEAYAAFDATTDSTGRSAYRNGVPIGEVTSPTGVPGSTTTESPFTLTSVDIGGILEDLAQWIIDALVHAFGQIIGTFEDLLNVVLEPVKRLTDGSFAKLVEHLFESLFSLFTDGKFVTFIESLFESLFGIFTDTDFGDFIGSFFQGLFDSIGSLTGGDFFNGLFSFVPTIAVSAGDFLTAVLKPITDLTVNVLHYLFGNSPTGIFGPIQKMAEIDVVDFLEGILKPIQDLTVGVADWVNSILLEPISDLTVGIIDYFTAVLYPIFDIGNIDFGDYIGMVLYPLYGLVVDAWDFIQAIFDPIFNMGGLDTGDFLTNLLNPVTDLSTDFGTFITKLFDTVFGGMTASPAALIEGLLSPFDGVKGTIEDLIDIIKKPFENLTGTLSNLLDIIKAPFSNLSGTLDNLLSIIGNPFKSLTGSVTSLVNIISRPFQNLTGSITNIVDVLKKPFENISGSAQTLIDLVTDALNFPSVTFDLLGKVTEALGGLFGKAEDGGIKLLYNPFNQFGIGPEYFLQFAKGGAVPEFADGGYIFGPSHANGGVPGVINGSGGDVPIEMEGGEYIINKKATRNIGLAALDQLNSMTGNSRIPDSLRFENGGTTTKFEGTKHIAKQGALNNLAGENGGGFTKNSFSILKFSQETGGTVRDIIGHHGIDVDLRIPDLIEKGKTNPLSFVKYFSSGGVVSPLKFANGGGTGGWSDLSPTEQQQIRERVTDQYSGSDSDTIYKPFDRFGNDVTGRVSLEVGAKDRMTKPVFNGKYEPPPWVPEWVKDAIEDAGEAIMDAFSDPAGFVENISDQVGQAIVDIAEAIDTAIGDVLDSIGLGGVTDTISNIFGGGGGGGGTSPYDISTSFIQAVKDIWYPDDAQSVTMISSLLNLDMLQSDISEIRSNVNELMLSWLDFQLGFGSASEGAGSYLELAFREDIFSGLSGYPQGDNDEFIEALADQIVGGTAIRKAFQHDQRSFDPYAYDMSTSVPRVQYGKLPNPFLGQNQETKPSGKQEYLWNALNLYGMYDSKNVKVTPNFGFIDGTNVVDFMGGMDRTKTGIFAQIFGRSGAEGSDRSDAFTEYRGGTSADLAAMGFEGKNYLDVYKGISGSDSGLYGRVAREMQGLAATIYKFLARQFRANSVLNLDFNKLKFAPSDIDNMTSDGVGFYKNGGKVVGASHENGGVLAELEDGEFVLKKSAVDAIGLDTLYLLNSGLLPKFQEGGVVVGRRDYDPLLAQAITEQYRNRDLEGGTYEQVQSVYSALQGSGLSGDVAAALTEIFGVQEGFFDQINFEGITETGITNSIIDGISDVFENTGTGTGGSYPVTVVSEGMYLDYMTRPLNAVIVTTPNYMEALTEPLPSRVYQTEYLMYLSTPLSEIGGISSTNYMNTVLGPLDDVVINSATLTEALVKVVDRIVIDNAMFNLSFVSKLMEMLASDDNSTVEIIDSIDKLYTKVENYFDDLIATQEEVINTQLTKIIELGEELSRITSYYEDIIAEKDIVISTQSAEITKLEKDISETKAALVEALNNITQVKEDLAQTQQELADALKQLAEGNVDKADPDEVDPRQPQNPGGTVDPRQPQDPRGGGGGGGGTPTPPPPPDDTGDSGGGGGGGGGGWTILDLPMDMLRSLDSLVFGRGEMSNIFDMSGFQTELDGFNGSFETNWSGFLGSLDTEWSGLMGTLGLQGGIGIGGLGTGMQANLDGTLGILQGGWNSTFGQLGNIGGMNIGGLGTAMGTNLNGTLGILQGGWDSTFGQLGGIGGMNIGGLGTGMQTNLSGTLGAIQGGWDTTLGNLNSFANGNFNMTGSMMQLDLASTATGIWNSFSTWMGSLLSQAQKSFQGGLGGAVNWTFGGGLGSLIDTNTKDVQGVYNEVEKAVKNPAKAVRSVGSRLSKGASSVAKKIFSDKRLKDNLKLVGVNSQGLNVYSFDWNSKANSLGYYGNENLGVIAQEVLSTIPGAVFNKNGYLGVDYSLINLDNINQFKNGGLTEGPSHQSGMLGLTNGGTPFLFEGGEYIINKKSAERLGTGFLDSINSYGLGGFVSSGKWKELITKDFKPSKKTAIDPVKNILEKGITPGGLKLDPTSVATGLIGKLFGSSDNKQLAQQRELERKQKEQQDKLMKMREEQMLMQQRMQEDMMKMQEQMMKDSMKMQEVMKDRMMMQNTSFEPTSFKPTSFKPTSFEPTSFDFTPAVYDGKMPSFLLDNSEESGLVARRDSSSMSYSSASSDLSESLRDGVTVSNNLLRRLITTLQDKDLSVTVVDTEGNEKDQSTYLIKRQNQLEYRNATELA